MSILNAPLAKHGSLREKAIAQQELDQLAKLAADHERLRIAFDHYAYSGYSAKTNRKSIVFRTNDDGHDELCWISASHRVANDDSVGRLPLTRMEGEIDEQMRARTVQRDFWAFYDAPANSDLIRQSRKLRDGVR
ncbi:MAG TPA: hypothetical protein VK466_09690, partial [Terriglobales bacterium]|nr:hypothetical protein [Terriglobales bacterium]